MRSAVTLLVCALLLCISSPASAAVDISVSGNVVYAPVGSEAQIPIIISSTSDHDVTGTLSLIMTPLDPGNAVSHNGTVTTRALSAFTEKRTVRVTAGRSEIPADFRVAASFVYSDGGERVASLDGIVVHFVTNSGELQRDSGTPLSGTDTAIPTPPQQAKSNGQEKRAAGENPAASLQNSQMPQDTTVLKTRAAQAGNLTGTEDPDLLATILADPLTGSLNQSLAGAGFALGNAKITPELNNSASFMLTYSSDTNNVRVSGILKNRSVGFAEEVSEGPVPLPEALLSNTSFQEYRTKVAGSGCLRDQSRINITTARTTVDLAYAGPKKQIIRLEAIIENGTVTALAGDTPEDPPSAGNLIAALACIILISAGIWYCARHRHQERNVPADPGSGKDLPVPPGEIAGNLLDDAEKDAGAGRYPEAYRKTSRALRIIISHRAGIGKELTSSDAERLSRTGAGEAGQIRHVLDRCLAVGFAKSPPDLGELRDMIRFVRTLLDDLLLENK